VCQQRGALGWNRFRNYKRSMSDKTHGWGGSETKNFSKSFLLKVLKMLELRGKNARCTDLSEYYSL
jgi:hypothetical protein